MSIPLRVLMIEDSPQDAKLIALELQRGGYEVAAERVDTPDALREALTDGSWDIILSDYSMPAFDAPAAIEILKETGWDIPIIIISGTIGEETAVICLKAGACDFLTKDHLVRLTPAIARELREAKERKARHEAEKSLKETQERFRTLADNIPNLTWMANADGWIFWYNKRWYEYTGTAPEEMEGWGWQSVHDAEMLPQVMERWKNSLTSGEPFNMVFPLKGADGVFRPFLTRVVPVRNSQGEIVQWFGTNTDITEQKEAEEALRESEKKLEEKHELLQQYLQRLVQSNKELEDFAFVASHDLQAPLRKVQLFSDFLKNSAGNSLSPDSLDYIERLQKAVRRMQELISDLLDLSRVTRKGQAFKKMDLSEVTKTVLEDLEADIRLVDAKIDVGTLCVIEADKHQMEQLLKNLIENSIKFHRQDTVPVVKVSSQVEDGTCLLTVEDNGIGFDELNKEQIFEVFRRLHGENSEYSGTGIGLSLVKKIVERHNGSIEVRSTPGKGSVFTVRLPLHQPV